MKRVTSFILCLMLIFNFGLSALALGIPTYEYSANISVWRVLNGPLGNTSDRQIYRYPITEVPAPLGKYFMGSIENLTTDYLWYGSSSGSYYNLAIEGLNAGGNWVNLGTLAPTNKNPITATSPFTLTESVSALRFYLITYNTKYDWYQIQNLKVGVGSLGADQKTVSDAKDAANQANTTMNTIISPKLDLVYGGVVDGSGNTALSMATLASQYASSAKTSADTTVSEIAKLNAKMDLRFIDLKGKGGALATKSTSFDYVIGHENANQYKYKLDNGSWSAWASLTTHDSQGYLTVPVTVTGPHTLTVAIRNNTGTFVTSSKQQTLTFFKLQ